MFEEYKPTIERAIKSSEEAAQAAIATKVHIDNLCGRIERAERIQEEIIKNLSSIDSPVHKAEICPYQDRLREAQRIIWGDRDAPGLIGEVDRLHKDIGKLNGRINKMYGALAVVSAIALSLLPLLISKL